jgi:UDP-N-acetylmuramoyl-tripeptide--D-alanyl-D-alanine ligase
MALGDYSELFYFFGFLWIVRTFRAFLFYLYLWQLKEYHIGRFLAHFETQKGKSLILNYTNILKIILLAFFLIKVPLMTFFGAIAFYLIEFFKTCLDIILKKIKKPILTKKAIFLTTVSFIFLTTFAYLAFLSYGFWEKFGIFQNSEKIVVFAFWLLVCDVLAPFFASLVVLLFQPLAVWQRNKIIKKAQKKIAKFPKLLVIGITGSYGKTSTKEFLYTILASKFGQDKVLKTQAHQNSEVGISQCILNNLNENHRIFIVEMGAYNVGGIKLLCDIAKPKIGVLTGINEQHLATFGSQENIIKAKYELIESLPENGLAFFNAKNKYCVNLYNQTKIKRFIYGQEANFFGEDAKRPGGENILGAMAVAKELGMTEEEIKRRVDKIPNKIPGIQIKKGLGGLKIIDATYSANPDGVIANLDYLKTFRQAQGKLILVMPCLIELGRASKEVHQRIGKKIGQVCDLAIITTSDRFADIKLGVSEVRPRSVELLYMENPKKIFEKIRTVLSEKNLVSSQGSEIKSTTQAGDVVLLESRVPKKLYQQLIG